MSNIENIKKSLDNVEKTLITKAVKDDTAKKELKESIAKQLDTLILKAEVDLLEKQFSAIGSKLKESGKSFGAAGKGIGSAGKALGIGFKDVGVGIGRVGAAAGKGIARAYKGTQKPTSVPAAGAISKPITQTKKKQETPTGIKSDFGGTTSATKTPGDAISGTSKLMEQADTLERQLTQPKKKATPTPAKTIKESVKPVEQPKIETPAIFAGTGEDTSKQMAAAQKKRSSGGI